MILGMVTFVLFLLECSFGLWKKILKRTVSTETLRKCHKGIGILTIALAFIHLVMTIGLWKQRPMLMFVSGGIALACIILAGILGLGKLDKVKLKYHKMLAILALLCLCIHTYSGVSSFLEYQNAVEEIQIVDVNVQEIPDGVYQGEWSVEYVYARVQVTVAEGTITKVDLLEHRNERGEPAEKIVESILAEQTLDVDVVSGATNSSNVIKKAVENALKSE